MTPEDRTKLVSQMVGLSKDTLEPMVKDISDAQKLDHAIHTMANNVIDQIVGLDESERLIVCMATMTKLLVENYILMEALSND